MIFFLLFELWELSGGKSFSDGIVWGVEVCEVRPAVVVARMQRNSNSCRYWIFPDAAGVYSIATLHPRNGFN